MRAAQHFLLTFILLTTTQAVFAQESYNHLKALKDPVSISLQDGSKVWLNKNATLGYPSDFSAKQKQMELSGEAFFQMGSKPKAKEIKLAGVIIYPSPLTQFNVNAGDSSIIVTSVKTDVSFRCNGKTYIVKRGEEAIITNQRDVNIRPWKNIDDIENWRKTKRQ